MEGVECATLPALLVLHDGAMELERLLCRSLRCLRRRETRRHNDRHAR
jgi:hypothetical protein